MTGSDEALLGWVSWPVGILRARFSVHVVVDMPRRVADSSGLGRNVALFNRLRLWAYRACRRYTNRTDWEEVVDAFALAVNEEFPVPLPAAEVLRTAQSVARWVWRNGFTAEGFRAEQARRGRRNTPEQQAAKRRRLDLSAALAYVEDLEVGQ